MPTTKHAIEEHDVVARYQRALQLRDHGVLEPVQPGPGIAALRQGGEQVPPDFRLHGPELVIAGTKFA